MPAFPDRSPVGVAVQDLALIVICSDGSVWRRGFNDEAWEEQRPIPGSERDRQSR
jgi:hypothetical protein